MNETTQKNSCPFFSRVSIGFCGSTPVSQQADPAREVHRRGGRTIDQITKGKEVPTWIRLQSG